MRKFNNQGYTLTDMLMTVMFLSLLSVMTLSKTVTVKEDYLNFVVDYNYAHAVSLLEGENSMDNEYSEYPIVFNELGTINMGQSFTIEDKRIIIRPITGYLRVE